MGQVLLSEPPILAGAEYVAGGGDAGMRCTGAELRVRECVCVRVLGTRTTVWQAQTVSSERSWERQDRPRNGPGQKATHVDFVPSMEKSLPSWESFLPLSPPVLFQQQPKGPALRESLFKFM